MSQWSEDYLLEKIITHSWHSYILQVEIEPLVIEAVKELVSDKYFAKEIEKRIGVQTDTTAIDKELANYESKVIWRSASKFGNKISNQEGYIPPEQYNFDCRLKPMDFSDVGQATVLAMEYKDILCYSSSTDYMV